jgi:hypothetical protein
MEAIMTYQDPDPRNRDIDPRFSPVDNQSGGSGAIWGWIAGIVVLVLMLVFLFGSGNENTRTTSLDNGAATSMTTPRPASPTTPPTPGLAPTQNAPSTTGQGQR